MLGTDTVAGLAAQSNRREKAARWTALLRKGDDCTEEMQS